MKLRRKFSKEFKQAAIRQMTAGKSAAEVARALEVHPSDLVPVAARTGRVRSAGLHACRQQHLWVIAALLDEATAVGEVFDLAIRRVCLSRICVHGGVGGCGPLDKRETGPAPPSRVPGFITTLLAAELSCGPPGAGILTCSI